MKLGEFFIQLGVQSDKKTVREFANALGDMTVDAAAAVIGLIGVEFELSKIAAEAMNAAVGFEMFKSETGLSWQELQRWQIAGAQVNVQVEAIASSISQLQRNLAEIRLGRGNIAPFQMLGVDTRGDAFSVLEQIRQRIRGLDRATATNMITQMGISPEMIRLLEISDDRFQKLAHTIHGMTTEQEKQFYDTKQTLIEWGLVLKEYGIDTVSHFINVLQFLGGAIKDLQLWWPGLIAGVVALGVAFAPITAAVVGLLLLLDDLAVYSQGGDSLFGALEKKYEKPGAASAGQWQLDHLPKWLTDFTSSFGSTIAGVPVSSGSVVNQTNNFSIHGNDPHAIGKEVKRQLDHATGAANQQFDNQGH